MSHWACVRLALLTLLNGLDATLTTLCVGSGVAYEVNPFMAWQIAAFGLPTAMAIKMAVVPACAYKLETSPPVSVGFGRTVPAGVFTAFLIGTYIAVCAWGMFLYLVAV